MKVIETHQLNDFTNHDALFFTEDGIIVDQFTQSPLMNFLSVTKKLSLGLNAIYLDGHVLLSISLLSLHL